MNAMQVHPIQATFTEDPDSLPYEPVIALEAVLIVLIVAAGIALLSVLNWVGLAFFHA